MIKRTLYFGNPAYLSTENRQLVIRLPDKCGSGNAVTKSIPIEDIGVVVLDNWQITITQAALESLSENASAVIVCVTALIIRFRYSYRLMATHCRARDLRHR